MAQWGRACLTYTAYLSTTHSMKKKEEKTLFLTKAVSNFVKKNKCVYFLLVFPININKPL